MKEESKIELLFEELIERIKLVESKLIKMAKEEGIKRPNDELLLTKLEIIEDSINTNLSSFVRKLNALNTSNQNQVSITFQPNKLVNESKAGLPFLGLMEAIKLFAKRRWVVVLFLSLFIVMAITNYYLYRLSSLHKADAIKYQYMKEVFPKSSNAMTLYLDSVWLNDAGREQIIVRLDSLNKVTRY